MGRKAKLSKEMKLRIVQEYIEGNVDISIKYGIINHSILHTWIKKYNSHIEIKDYNPKGDVYMAKSR
ncbi:MAG: transposase, partial [Bacilli bacterium]|nr:transposase [Bacilli bacterium]